MSRNKRRTELRLKYELGKLQQQHRDLDAEIKSLERRVGPTATVLYEAKSRKLRLRDDIALIQAGLEALQQAKGAEAPQDSVLCHQ